MVAGQIEPVELRAAAVVWPTSTENQGCHGHGMDPILTRSLPFVLFQCLQTDEFQYSSVRQSSQEAGVMRTTARRLNRYAPTSITS